MLEPAALAETVTPPIFSPAAEVTVPLSSASAACAGVTTEIAPDAIAPDAIMMAIRLAPVIRFAPVKLRAFAMASLREHFQEKWTPVFRPKMRPRKMLIVLARRALRPCRSGRGGRHPPGRKVGLHRGHR